MHYTRPHQDALFLYLYSKASDRHCGHADVAAALLALCLLFALQPDLL